METPHVDGELSLKEIQQESLSILKEIDAVCRKENIRYWVMYGTLIGAVRHHGFIPWDDDLDIAMPRPDYERFLSYCDGHADALKPLVVLHNTNDQMLPFLITRVSDTDYKMIGEYGDELPEMGTFVDVYPIDGCGNSRDEALQLKSECSAVVSNYLRAANFNCNNMGASAVKCAIKSIRARMLGDPTKYRDELHELATRNSFEDSSYCGCLVWPMDKGLLLKHEQIDDLLSVQFEDTQVLIPSGYDDILKGQYGDYMQLPPKNERVGHHFYSIVRR